MRILFTIHRLGNGGAERVVANYANRLVHENEVGIFVYDIVQGFHYDIHTDVRIECIDTNLASRKSFISRKFFGVINFFKLFRHIKNYHPDIIISFYTKQNIYSTIVSKILRIPIIISERDHFFLTDGWLNRSLRKIIYPLADGYIFQTNQAKEALISANKLVNTGIVLPNPIWMTPPYIRSPQNGYLLSIGRLEEQKNFSGLIRAFSKMNRAAATLHIVGEGPLRENLESLAKDLGVLDKVFFHGLVSDVRPFYEVADIFILFSNGEGYPNVLIEAMAFGLPCIATDCPVGASFDLIEHSKNGMIIKVEDELTLTATIEELLLNPQKRFKIASEATAVQNKNDFNLIYNKFLDYLEGIYAKSKRGRR